MRLTKYRSILKETVWRKDENIKDIKEILEKIEEVKKLSKKFIINEKLGELIRLIKFFWEENEYGDVDIDLLLESDLPYLKKARASINRGPSEVPSVELKELGKTLEYVKSTFIDYKKQIISNRN